MALSSDQMPSQIEQVIDSCTGTQETLRLPNRLELSHALLLGPRRLMKWLGPIILVLLWVLSSCPNWMNKGRMGHLRYILDTARPIPLSKRSLTKRPVILGFHQMTAKPKQVVYAAMTGEKSLSLSMRWNPLICRSCCRVSWWDNSRRLFSYCAVECSTLGIMPPFAAE